MGVKKQVRRLTKSGLKRRRTYRINQVKKNVSKLEIGASDKEKIIDLLSKDVQTKRGFERSKKLESAIFSKDVKRVKRFKEFRNIKNGNISEITRQLKSDADFYNKNRDLILDYNSLSDTEKENRRNKTVINFDTEFFAYLNQKQKNKL